MGSTGHEEDLQALVRGYPVVGDAFSSWIITFKDPSFSSFFYLA